jgi:hypothetical protein
VTFTPFGAALGLVATTGAAGYTLVNGTGNILSWTAPNDGQPHRVLLFGELIVTTLEAGGTIQVAFTPPTGGAQTATLLAGGLAAGYRGLNNVTFMVAPGTTVTIQQSAALTSGAAVMFLEVWAA